jgi:nicotinate-nucleotide adenylyltransferase
MGRVGILGGTFNPPHAGHCVCAQGALADFVVDRVLLMPVHTPPQKLLADDPGPEHRLEMCRLAAGEDPRIAACGLEVERGGLSYTVDTLAALHERHPGDELTWIAGADVAASLESWREPERVFELARLAVAERAGTVRAEIEHVVGRLGGADALTFLDIPRVDVSATVVRRRVAAGLPIGELVPAAVAAYIAAHGLYRGAAGAP